MGVGGVGELEEGIGTHSYRNSGGSGELTKNFLPPDHLSRLYRVKLGQCKGLKKDYKIK